MNKERTDLTKLYPKHKDLLIFFNELDRINSEVLPGDFDCGSCNKCCRFPYFYMTLHQPEFELIQEYISKNRIPIRVHFEEHKDRKLDKRVYYADWLCPLYRRSLGGCSVYPVRPFSCRVYGAWSTLRSPIEDCVYLGHQKMYEFVDDLPFWTAYIDAIAKYENTKRGYVFPDSALYELPVLEYLMGFPNPWGYDKNYHKTDSL